MLKWHNLLFTESSALTRCAAPRWVRVFIVFVIVRCTLSNVLAGSTKSKILLLKLNYSNRIEVKKQPHGDISNIGKPYIRHFYFIFYFTYLRLFLKDNTYLCKYATRLLSERKNNCWYFRLLVIRFVRTCNLRVV